MTINILN